jgi:PEP-CTERM motif-containing protein
MKISLAIGSLCAILSLTASTGWAAVAQFNGNGNDFLTAGNWTPAGVPSAGNQYIINNGLTANYTSNAATTIASLIVGADYPVTGDLGTAGTFNMSAGSMEITGGSSAFTIARACCSGDGVVNLTNNALLTIDGSDPQVGQRDHGELHIGPSASVVSPTSYWRLGNYGASIDNGLQGDGLLEVQGSFLANVIFIGDSDSHGELRVSGHGSVTLNDSLVPNVATNFPNRSALVQMIGSNASIHAVNDESANGAAEVHNRYIFTADAGGISPITLSDAVNIGNNDLTVNLAGYAVLPNSVITLFDAAPNRIFGTFANVTITGSSVPGLHVLYDQASGNIEIATPEPSSMLLLGIGATLCSAFSTRRSLR